MAPASEPISSATAITIAAATPNMISTRNMSASLRSGLRGAWAGRRSRPDLRRIVASRLKAGVRGADEPTMSHQPGRGPTDGRLPAALALGALSLALAAYAVVTFRSLGSAGLQDAFGRWVYDAVLLGPAALVLVRAWRVREERAAWLFLGAGLLSFALGQTYYSVVLYYAYPAPFPSPADGLFLAMYPAIFVAFALLLRSRAAAVEPLAWLDGLIGALAVAAIAAALIFPPVLDALGGSAFGVAVNLAYPCMDLVLLGMVAAAFAVSGWRSQGAWRLIGAALLLFGVSDVIYLWVGGQATEALDIASVGWPLAFLLLATAAWLKSPAGAAQAGPPRRSIVLPIFLATAVIALLVVASFHSVGTIAVALGAASLVAVLIRLAITFRQNARMLEVTRREATTDELTGLGNRRSLMAALEAALAASADQPETGLILVMFDLDGFKSYNDSFGHPAGDALLRRLGAQLAAALVPHGTAFRLGGDEFCVLARTNGLKAAAIAQAAQVALSDHGEGLLDRRLVGHGRGFRPRRELPRRRSASRTAACTCRRAGAPTRRSARPAACSSGSSRSASPPSTATCTASPASRR